MKKLFKLEIIGSIASILALLLFLYFQFIYQEKIIIEIQSINNETLTTSPTDNKLTARYFFNDIQISRLEKMHFLIKNSGNRNIIGQGNQKDLLMESLPLNFTDNKNFKILDIEIINKNFPITLKTDSLFKLNFFFKQWKVNEYVEIIAYIQNNSSLELPNFSIDDRDILNTQITYTDFQPRNEKRKLIDFFNVKIQKVLFWLAVILYSLLILATVNEIFKQTKNPELDTLWFKITITIIGIMIILIQITPFLWIIKI